MMKTNKSYGMEACAADSREQRDLRRVLMRGWINGTVRNKSLYSL